MKLKVNEAIARATMLGRTVKKKDLAAKLWPNSSEGARSMNMTNLCTGKTTKIDPEMVDIICKELDCTADFLFGRMDN